jgi:hypothetical protein
MLILHIILTLSFVNSPVTKGTAMAPSVPKADVTPTRTPAYLAERS